jgi:hypothetical protein
MAGVSRKQYLAKIYAARMRELPIQLKSALALLEAARLATRILRTSDRWGLGLSSRWRFGLVSGLRVQQNRETWGRTCVVAGFPKVRHHTPMTEFEYLAVLVSLILGLGITHLLSGVGRMIHRRGQYKLDAAHLLWTAATFWILILNWWVFFESRRFEEWSFSLFLIVIVWAVLFFLMAVVLYPPDMSEGEDYAAVFERNRTWFLGLFVASSVSDIALTASRGDILEPPTYLPFVVHLAVLGALGIVIKSRRFQVALAGYILGIALTWSLVVRRFLGG